MVMPQDTAPTRSILKRDGSTVQEFDVGKIERAVCGAYVEVHGESKVDETVFKSVSREVMLSLPIGVVDVETVQDAVEVALMRRGHFAVAKAYILYRQKRAEARLIKERKPDTRAMSDYIHASKYARYRSDLGRREVYVETVARVEAMHVRRFPDLRKEINEAFDLVREQKVLPSMRSMQFAGEAIESNHNRLYNCSFGLIDRPEAFGEAMFLLLCGCGVGYSVQFEHVEKLPALGYVDQKRVVHHVVEDSIEGWADALKAMLRAYLDGHYVEFAYHLIRPAGAPLRTSGGRAPGHTKLKWSLENIRKVLDAAQGRKLRPIECHRILCLAADAVLSGGIRRSAMIALFSLDDSEMMNAKTGNWFERDPWFSNANNSVALRRDEVIKKQFRRIFEMTRQWGEPGFFFTQNLDYGCNPCVPAGTRILTRSGYRRIEDLIGCPTTVWNGIEWREVTPRVTGHDQSMVRVHLSDGTFLDCTAAHMWCIAVGKWTADKVEERVRAKDLEAGDALVRYNMPVIEGGPDMAYAYTHGFWCADGVLEDADRKTAQLYGIKRTLVQHLDCLRTGEPDEELDRLRVVFPKEMPPKFTVPTNASVRSRLDWLAGLLDGDGTVVHNPKSINLQLTSIHLEFLREVRLMLTTLGVQAKIGRGDEGGYRTMPDGHGGSAEYMTQPNYRLLINATDTHQLVRLGLKTHRLNLSAARTPPQRDARRFVLVESVEPIPTADVVYCFTETSNNTGTFEGIVTGQCGEIGLNPVLDDVHTGWAFCNLCEINAAKLTSLQDFMRAAKAATLIGTLQAAYTDFPYLGWVSEAIAKREALLGIGMTGMLDAPDVACNPDFQKKVARKVKEWNAEYAASLGIQPAARTTCVKPSGTASLELGGVASGHHAHHAHRYIRRVTADELEFVFQAFRDVNPHACVRKPDGKWVIEFPVEAPTGAVVKKDLSALRFLEMVRSTQRNWVLPGTARNDVSPGLNHNVSNTVHVAAEEWDRVADYLWDHAESFTGVSLLPTTADKAYPFAPNEEIVTEADEARWNVLVTQYKPVDYAALQEGQDGTDLSGEIACAGGACSV